MLLVWVCSNGIVSVPSNTRLWQRLDMTSSNKTPLLYMQQIVGLSPRSRVSCRLTAQWSHVNSTYSSNSTRLVTKKPLKRDFDLPNKKKFGMENRWMVVKWLRGSWLSWALAWHPEVRSSILGGWTFKQSQHWPSRIILGGLSIYPGMNVHLNYTTATNEPVQDCSIYIRYNFQKVGTWFLQLGHWRMTCVI